MKLRFLILLFLMSLLLSCNKHKTPSKIIKSYSVKMSNIHKTLYFNGMVQPIREYEIATPMSAVVKKIHYQYGNTVKKDDILFTLSSMELQRQYHETLTNYLKSKDRYDIMRSKFNGIKSLWKEGLESKNNYLNEKSNLITARITLMQDSRTLSELIEKTEEEQSPYLSNLSFKKFDKVRLALNAKHNQIYLKAPHDGVLLYPLSADNAVERMNPGRSIKADQVLGIVGDLSGIRIEISIPEVDIFNVKIGTPAVIHCVALAKKALKGQVVSMSAQALSNTADGLPSFNAMIEIPKLDQDQKKWIKVGMSTDIELIIDNMDKLLIPIAAVKSNKGQSIVDVQSSGGVIIHRPVRTGDVIDNKVVIISGLKVGDVVIYE